MVSRNSDSKDPVFESPQGEEIPNKDKAPKKVALYVFGCVIWAVTMVGSALVGVVGYKYTEQNWFAKDSKEETAEEDKDDQDKDQEDGEVIDYTESSEDEIITKVSEIVEEARPSVVSVAKSDVSLGEGGASEISDSIGTGFVIDSNGGMVLTNQHVVDDPSLDYTVITSEGDSYVVTEVYSDDAYDLALLEVDFEGNSPAELSFGDSDLLNVGEPAIAIGNPLGDYPGTVTQGIISGLNRDVEAADNYGNVHVYEGVVQTDAAINFGNSGGPLLNIEGKVVGVNFGVNRSYSAEGISFAIPINNVKTRIEVFNDNGYFPKPYIGVEYFMVDEVTASVYQVPQGAFVQTVIRQSPAAEAGVKKGDIIIEIEGEKLTSSLSGVIQKYEVGDEIKIKVWRSVGGQDKEIPLRVTLEDGGEL